MAKQVYEYVWVLKKKLPERRGQRCRVIGERSGPAILVEFRDRQQVVCAPSAVRRAEDEQ
jgi:hypothetical protein